MVAQPPVRVTLADVARAAGVSTALVSIVMREVPGASPANRQRVLAVAAELGYRPDRQARLLRRNRSRLLGVAFDVEGVFHAELIDVIYRAADDAGYDVVLSAVTPSRDETRAVDTLLADRCEALLLLGSRLAAVELGRLRRQLPLVLVARRVRGGTIDSVHTAERTGMRLAVDHLVALGHRRIVHVDGGRAPGAADRRAGYRSAMRRCGLLDETRLVTGGPAEDDGAAAGRQLLRDPLPTAVLAFNDSCAVGLLDTVVRAGVAVPQQLSVVGYDNSRLAGSARVELTTVGQDVEQLGRLAVDRAIARLDPAFTAAADIEVAPSLVVRCTTAAPARKEQRA